MTMFTLKKLSREGIARALQKVERYRLLNEPWEAESICRDVLESEPNHQDALISLLLALTDQFKHEGAPGVESVRALLARIEGEYERAYYSGIICERKGSALRARNALGSGPIVYDWLRQAMECYDRAAALRPEGDDDALLRWNTCARLIMSHPKVQPPAPAPAIAMLE